MKTKKILTLVVFTVLAFNMSFGQLDDGKYKFYNDSISVVIISPSLVQRGNTADIEIYNLKSKKSIKSSLEYMEANGIQWYQSLENQKNNAFIELDFNNDYMAKLTIDQNKKSSEIIVKQKDIAKIGGTYKNKIGDILILKNQNNNESNLIFDINGFSGEICSLNGEKGRAEIKFSRGLKHIVYSSIFFAVSIIDEGNESILEESQSKHLMFEIVKDEVHLTYESEWIGADCASSDESSLFQFKKN